MHSWEDIEENRWFSNGGTNLHIHAIAQGRPEDNQFEFLQGPHGIVNPPKNLVLNNIRRFTQMANGLLPLKAVVSQPENAWNTGNDRELVIVAPQALTNGVEVVKPIILAHAKGHLYVAQMLSCTRSCQQR